MRTPTSIICSASPCARPATIPSALTYYTKALALDPDHKGAREYLGELYVETGQLDKAKEQLVVLTRLCPTGCEELEDLQKAIAAKVGN